MQPFGTMQDSGVLIFPKEFSRKQLLVDYHPVCRLLASLLLVFLTVGVTKVQSQVVINEVLANTSVELKNLGNSTVDVSNYWLCNFPDYAQLSQLTIICGDLEMAPGELLTVEVAGSVGGVEVPSNDGELGLYINSSFGSPNSIRDYVEWGSSGHGRSSVAVAASIWTSGDFVSAFGANESIEYTGTGDVAASWASTASPTINCMENSNAGNDCDVFVNDINLPGGATSTSICVDGVGDPLDVETNGGTADASRGWIITDDVGNILALPAAPPFDLDGAGVGVCEIWYIRYEDNGEFGGNTVGNNLTDLTGCFALSNPITVIREAPDGGMVSLTNGETTYTGTAGDIVVEVQHTTAAPNLSYWYIITDDNDNILAFMNSANGNSLDLSAAPPGECHIWGWSYRGLADPVVGDNISTLTDDACEAISDNFIRVIREASDCDVFVNDINLPGGATSTSICVDGVADPLDVETNGGTADASRGWIITDDLGNILALPAAPPFDLDGAGVGVCEIWYIRYEDNGEFGGNTVGNNLTDLTGCFALSNPITVIREAPDGGMVTLTNGETTYTGTAGDIVVEVQHTTAAPNLSYWYIITDDNDNILAFMNSANGNSLDLSAAPPGECHIWGWSYRGLSDPIVGDNISTLTDDACEAISDNFIRVIREAPCDVFVNDINLPGGATSTSICVDGVADPLDVETNGGTADASRGWIITDDLGNILALPAAPPFNLDGAGVGVCEIWYIRYEDNGEFGGNTVGNNLTDLTGCFALSNPITVIREAPDGGMVSLTNGETTYTGTAGDIVVEVQHTTAAPNLSYWYIITDDNDNILAFMNSANGNSLDLSGAPPGECHIWGWSYRGLGDPVVGDNISTLTDDACEAISDNFIRVIREAPCDVFVNDINLPGGATSTSICVDGVGDPLDIETNGGTADASRGWIITDDVGNILALPAAPPFDLDGAGVGVCQIWYIRYEDNGAFGGNTVGNNLTDLTGCYALSNPVTVIREAPDGGMVSLTNGETTYMGTAGDIVVQVQHTTAAPNLSYWYIITDDNDNILAFMNSADGNSLDLSVAPPGECHIWGWSYRGLADPVVGDHISSLTDDACEAISDNFIRVIREPEVCDIYVGRIKLKSGGTRRTICVDDTPDPLYVRTSGGTPNTARAWIITDDAGNILATPAAPPFDLNGAGVGVCQIWYLRYYDTEEFGGNEVGNNLSDLTGCYAISNPITVVRMTCEDSCDAPSWVRVTRVTRNTATIDWNNVSPAVTYHVRYRRAFSNRWRYRVTTRSNTTLRRLRRNTKYFVQVRTYCAGPERSEWSNVKAFRTLRSGYYLQDNTGPEATEANKQVTEFSSPNVPTTNEGPALDSQVLPFNGIEQGESSFAEVDVKLFPNPVQSQLNIETNMQGEQVIARIFSTTGQLVKQLQIAGDQLQSVDLTELQAGMYILSIQNGEQQLSRTFIKK
ncbi:MAG: T9SS type A sorting domain-containing protein [Cyanothece sp. SIO1E1]|nr:T9SS type A sorting domain-containing protein [Cyanothece sp. SIO1E1]